MEIKKLIETMSELCENSVKKVTNEDFSEIELDAMSKAIDLLFDIMQFPGFTLEEQQQIDQAYLVLKAHHSAETESIDEAKMEKDSLDNSTDVMLDKISQTGIRCYGYDYGQKTVAFGYVCKSTMAKHFTASKDNEIDPKQVAEECAGVLKKHLDPAEDEILAILDKYGYKE